MDTQQDLSGFAFEPDLTVSVEARSKTSVRQACYYAVMASTLGFAQRVFAWFPVIDMVVSTGQCTFADATHVWAASSLGPRDLIPMQRIKGSGLLFFDYYGTRFVFQGDRFVALDDKNTGHFIQEAPAIFGSNRITFFDRSFLSLAVDLVLSPYNIFQAACIILWVWQREWVYVTVIGAVTLLLTALDMYEEWSALCELCSVAHRADGEKVELSSGSSVASQALLPGDEIAIRVDQVIPADVVLLRGTVLVDESMLSGESTSVAKSAATSAGATSHLYAGTVVKAVSEERCTGRVVAIGNATMRAHMLQSIVYPRSISLPLIRDANRVVIAVGLLSAAISLAILSAYFAGLANWFLVVRSTDLFAVIFELYAVIRLCAFWPNRRLRTAGIVCRRTERVMQAGAVDTVCFDKTGTLTEAEMRFVGLADGSGEFRAVEAIGDNSELMRLMATCHSLQRTEAGISGDAMDAELFKAAFAMKSWAAFQLAEPVDTAGASTVLLLSASLSPVGGAC